MYYLINGGSNTEKIEGNDIKVLYNYYREYNNSLYELLIEHKYKDLPPWLNGKIQ